MIVLMMHTIFNACAPVQLQLQFLPVSKSISSPAGGKGSQQIEKISKFNFKGSMKILYIIKCMKSSIRRG